MFYTPRTKLVTFLCLAGCLVPVTAGLAQDNSPPTKQSTPQPESIPSTYNNQEPKVQWEMHRVPGGTCDVRFPTDYKYRENFIQINPEEAYYTYEASTENEGKTYAIRMEQGFGPPLALNTVRSILSAESAKYQSFAESLGGEVISDEDVKQDGFYGKEVVLSYTEKNKKHSMRVRVFLTDIGKVTILHVGTSDSIYSYRSNSFFDTIKLRDGISKRKGDPKNDGWNSYESPNKVYTARLPAVTDEYIPAPPTIKASQNKDFIGITLKDPLRGYLSFYNIYSYKMPAPITEESAKKLLATQHVVKFAPKFPIDTLNFKISKKEDHYTMNTQVLANAAPEFPYINSIIFNAHIKGNYIVVQELISAGIYASSPLIAALIENIDFHPENFSQYSLDTPDEQKDTKAPETQENPESSPAP